MLSYKAQSRRQLYITMTSHSPSLTNKYTGMLAADGDDSAFYMSWQPLAQKKYYGSVSGYDKPETHNV